MNISHAPENPARPVKQFVHTQGATKPLEGLLALEAPLELLVNDRAYSLLMRTPGHDPDLVTGFLFTEGLIKEPGDLAGLEFVTGPEILGTPGMRAHAHLPAYAGELPERPSVSMASCGLCGQEALPRASSAALWVRSRQVFDWRTLEDAADDLPRHQDLYRLTRGTHAVGVYAADGQARVVMEDVGRHNAMDKAIGYGLARGWDFSGSFIVLSGRASLEMILKTARAGIPLLLCFSSPTVLAVHAARELNLTLVAVQGRDRLAAFTHVRRLPGTGEEHGGGG